MCHLCDGTDTIAIETGPDGFYSFFVPAGTYDDSRPDTNRHAGRRPPTSGTTPSTATASPTASGYSVATGGDGERPRHRFRVLHAFGAATGHRHARDTGRTTRRRGRSPSITVGGVTYTKAQAIAWLGKVGKDKTTTMFSSLVPAMLNVLIGNDGSCVNSTIAAADNWMATLRTRWQQRGGVELRVDGRRTAAQPDGQLQQRPALRSASPVETTCPMALSKGHRASHLSR